MTKITRTFMAAMLALGLAGFVSSCDNGQAGKSGENNGAAMQVTRGTANDAMQNTANAAEDAGQNTKDAAEDAAKTPER